MCVECRKVTVAPGGDVVGCVGSSRSSRSVCRSTFATDAVGGGGLDGVRLSAKQRIQPVHRTGARDHGGARRPNSRGEGRNSAKRAEAPQTVFDKISTIPPDDWAHALGIAAAPFATAEQRHHLARLLVAVTSPTCRCGDVRRCREAYGQRKVSTAAA